MLIPVQFYLFETFKDLLPFCGMLLQRNQGNAAIAPEDLGSMGYDGDHNLFVKGTIRDEAYRDSGLSLDFYKSYNTTFHSPQEYFGKLSDLNPQDFFLCDADGLEFSNALRMSDYIRWTGDLDGVTKLANGQYMARCPDGRFWLAPACRHNSTECIPLLAAGNGWIVDAMMQWWRVTWMFCHTFTKSGWIVAVHDP